MPQLCLLTVHAHPDDEASKGAGTVAKYHAEGIETVLVTCTGGEQGDILNPAMDRPGIRERLPEIRRGELDRAAAIIGYDHVALLGYRDSGMPDTPANADPLSFAQAPEDEAVGKLVALIRRFRPQVVVTYPPEQKGYPHPDHLRVNDISELAFDAAGDPDRFGGRGEPWQPLKLYYVSWSVKRMLATHDKFVELGMDSPYTDERLQRALDAARRAEEGGADRPPTTEVDITGLVPIGRRALLAHETQIDPTSPHWFGLPEEVADQLYPFDEYQLARNLTDSGPTDGDLFAGIRTAVRG
ncbi:MAG: mycothiol conjugate amidase Mca [Actinomycetes bacterium]